MTNFAKTGNYGKDASRASWALAIAWLLLGMVGVLIVARGGVLSVRAGDDARSVLHHLGPLGAP